MPRKKKLSGEEAARKLEEKRSAEPAAAASSSAAAASSSSMSDGAAAASSAAAAANADALASAQNPRVCTGVLVSHPQSRDVQMDSFSLSFHGIQLVTDSRLELNFGRRYGLIGINGCGKSTMLACIGHREVPIPKHIDSYFLSHEIEASDRTALEAVMGDVEAEKHRLEEQAAEVLEEVGAESPLLIDIYERIDALDADTAEARAAEILHGLGFTPQMQRKATKDFSGGWRMRIALSRALFIRPTLLLLDEPTNHLDLEACVWLEEYLKKFNRILLMVSHSQDFLNGVCTNIIRLQNKKLSYFSGNYESFITTNAELEENQMKRYNREQDEIAHMKNYIARFGHGSAKLARQAQSKEKTLAKMVNSGLAEKVVHEKKLKLRFPSCGSLPPPVLQLNEVSFGYPGGALLYENLEFGIDLDSRIALVGPNGAGKSTLLKLIEGKLTPTSGQIRPHQHLKMARYHQHLTDLLDLDLSPLEFMLKTFPDELAGEMMRRYVGRFGLTGPSQTTPIRHLSDGQKSRVVFAYLAYKAPHILLLDEPTNHLDLETIDALAEAINEFEGGLVLVSHDFRLIDQVAKEIWICDHRTVTKYDGDIHDYKAELRARMGL